MELEVHVGPVKTATTSIQYVLDERRPILARHGIWYPAPPPGIGARSPIKPHHYVAYGLRNMDPLFLGIESELPELTTEIERWLDEARDASCSRILVSSEHLEFLDLSHWNVFDQCLAAAEQRSGVVVDQVTILYTERDNEAMFESAYAEYAKHGMALSRSEAEPIFSAETNWCRNLEISLPGELGPRYRFVPIDGVFVLDESGKETVDLGQWFEFVLGRDVIKDDAWSNEAPRLNERLSRIQVDELVTFNRINTPDGLHPLRPFLEAGPEAFATVANQRLMRFRHELGLSHELREKAHNFEVESMEAWREVARLRDVEAKLNLEVGIQTAALDDARRQIDDLVTSRSWRWTWWLRAISEKFSKNS
jgi:hypothetical protein